MAAVAQRPAMEPVGGIDGKAYAGKKRRQMDHGVQSDQRPKRPVSPPRADDVEKQQQDHRPDGIPENRHQRPEKGLRPVGIQQKAQIIPHSQAEDQHNDGQHDPFVLSADVGVHENGKRQSGQQQENRDINHELRSDLPAHKPLSFPLFADK